MRALLIVNPNATSTTPRYRSLVAHAIGSAIDLAVISTNHRGHARELAAESVGYDLVIGFGGDGTVNEVVNGLVNLDIGKSHGPRLGVIPGGDVNVFARAAGIASDPTEATEQLIESIANNRTRALNLGYLRWEENESTHTRIFNFSTGIGLDAAVVHEVDRLRKLGNRSSLRLYLIATGKSIIDPVRRGSPKPLALLTKEHGRKDLAMALITATDPWTYIKERPLRPTPHASFDSGIDMMGITSGGIIALFNAGQTLLRGGTPHGRSILHLHDQESIVLESEVALPLQADGEPIGFAKRVEIFDLPKALEIYY
jgi:diacylglycerol kinase family enzyme